MSEERLRAALAGFDQVLAQAIADEAQRRAFVAALWHLIEALIDRVTVIVARGQVERDGK